MSRFLAVVVALSCLLPADSALAVDRLVVMEHFSNCDCDACAYNEPFIRSFMESYKDRVVVVQYHVWWPWSYDPFYRANIPENTARTNFYAVSGVPHILFDGRIEPTYPYYESSLENAYQQAIDTPATVIINASGVYEPASRGGVGTLTADVIALEEQSGADLRLLVAICENGIHYAAPNGLTTHYWVMRDMVPDAEGRSVLFSAPYPDTLRMTEDFTIASGWVPDSCYFAVFLQNFGTATKVKQAAKVWLRDFTLTDVAAHDLRPAVTGTALGQNFPNPCNPATVIPVSLGKGGAVSLGIFDVEGRRVRSLVRSNLTAGRHEINWDGRDDLGHEVPSGIYYCRLEADGRTDARKMVVIR